MTTQQSQNLPGGDREPGIESIKSELSKILNTQGAATISLSTLRQAWAKKEGRVLFFAKPRLEALAKELHCEYQIDQSGNTTTFLRRKTKDRKGDKPV